MKRKAPKGKPRARRTGLMPNESRRRSLVTIERTTLVGDADRYGRESMTASENYIVTTRRLDGVWVAWVEYKGERWELPGKVIARLITHREAIISEERSRRAQDQTDRLRARAEQDQEKAEIASAYADRILGEER